MEPNEVREEEVSIFARVIEQAFTPEELQEHIDRYSTIVQHPDRRLSRACTPVTKTDIESGDIFPLLEMLTSHLESSGGVGLAANQIGATKRVIALRYENGVVAMINPRIVLRRGNVTMSERCLSVSEGSTPYAVKRSKKISVSFDTFREDGEGVVLGNVRTNLEGLGAVVFQHELDHLNGLTIVDRGKYVSEPNKEPA